MKKTDYSEKIKAKNQKNEHIMAVVGITVCIVVAIAAIAITISSIVRANALEPWEEDKKALIGSWTEDNGQFRYTFDENEIKMEVNVNGEMQTRVYRQYAIGKQEKLLRIAANDGKYTDIAYRIEGKYLYLTLAGDTRVFIRDE